MEGAGVGDVKKRGRGEVVDWNVAKSQPCDPRKKGTERRDGNCRKGTQKERRGKTKNKEKELRRVKE